MLLPCSKITNDISFLIGGKKKKKKEIPYSTSEDLRDRIFACCPDLWPLPMPHQAQQLSSPCSSHCPLRVTVWTSSLLSRAPEISLQQPPHADAHSPACCLSLLLSLISSKPCVPQVSHGKCSYSHINLVILFCCFILLSKSFSLPEITCIFSRPVYFSFFHWSMNPKKTKLGHGLWCTLSIS